MHISFISLYSASHCLGFRICTELEFPDYDKLCDSLKYSYLHFPLTSQPACLLYHLVDFLQTLKQLLVVVGADLVASDQVTVQRKQLVVTFLHVLPGIIHG